MENIWNDGKSKFDELFGDKIPDTTIGSISSIVTKGTTPTTIGYNFIHTGVNFVKVENIDCYNTIKGPFSHISEECNNAMKRSSLEDGDILFSIAGTLGKCAVVSDDILPANTNQALAIIRLSSSKVSPIYLKFALLTDNIKKQMEFMKVVANRENLSLKNIEDFKVFIPDLSLQQLFLNIVDEYDKLKFIIKIFIYSKR